VRHGSGAAVRGIVVSGGVRSGNVYEYVVRFCALESVIVARCSVMFMSMKYVTALCAGAL